MNRLCWQLAITGTALVSIYDPPTRVLRWARAGHMPPVLVRGTAELLATVRETMVAVATRIDERTLLELRARLEYASPDDDTCTVAVRVLSGD